MMASIPLADIDKAEVYEFDVGKTAIAVAVGVVVTSALVTWKTLDFQGGESWRTFPSRWSY
ncbi:hypothetical protein ACFL6E_07685 [Candidatus Neomarinimicrobiota bacterium]